MQYVNSILAKTDNQSESSDTLILTFYPISVSYNTLIYCSLGKARHENIFVDDVTQDTTKIKHEIFSPLNNREGELFSI